MQEFAKRFYKSKAWQRVRDKVWRRDKGLCQWCLWKGIIREGVEVHHIIELTPENITNAEISLNPDNLILLCRDCHGSTRKNTPERYTVDELGRVIIK